MDADRNTKSAFRPLGEGSEAKCIGVHSCLPVWQTGPSAVFLLLIRLQLPNLGLLTRSFRVGSITSKPIRRRFLHDGDHDALLVGKACMNSNFTLPRRSWDGRHSVAAPGALECGGKRSAT